MDTVIVISSCDLYSDCWLPMISSFRKFWRNCPYPIYFISNFKCIEVKGINFIKIGEHKGFGSNMNKALDLIDSDFVILFLEDFFLNDAVDNDMVNKHIYHCAEKNIDFLKIDSCDIIFRDDMKIGDSCYCANPLDIKYSLNAAIAIWKKDVLQSLCVEGFTAWDFERKGLDYIKKNNLKINSETILSTDYDKETIKKICGAGAIRKGRWTFEGLDFLTVNGFESLIDKREMEGRFTRYLTSFYTPNSLLWIPLGLMLRIIQKLKINI